jgi:hypothetical protein
MGIIFYPEDIASPVVRIHAASLQGRPPGKSSMMFLPMIDILRFPKNEKIL